MRNASGMRELRDLLVPRGQRFVRSRPDAHTALTHILPLSK